MKTNAFLGEFEQFVLLATARLGNDAYGVAIRQEIEDRAGRGVSIGSAYQALDRLERKGYLNSAVGEPTPERGGRAKRYYTLSAEGLATVVRLRETLDRFWSGLDLEVRP